MTWHAAAETEARPIFILSCERSGSTLLRLIVDTHSEIACPGQLYLGPVSEDLYRAVYYSLGQTCEAATEKDRRELVLREVRAMVGGLMDRYAAARSKRFWCEKTTLNADYLQTLSALFPGARYVCLYRNCMDVVHSCLKFNPLGFMPELAPCVRKDPENLVAAMAGNWLEKNERISAFEAAHPDRCFRVHYESLAGDPEAALPPLFEFLGVGWEEGILQKVFSVPHDQGEGDLKVLFSKGINADSIGKGRSIPLAAVPDGLRERIDWLNERLDYPGLEGFYQARGEARLPADPRPETRSAAGRVEPDEFFRVHVRDILGSKEADIAGVRGVCRFVVEGERGGAWLVDLSRACAEIREAREEDQADCTIAITYGAFRELAEGSASAGEIYERGEVTASGNDHLALRFGKLLFG
jgi:protein-tyrosine sulfotransferase